MRIVEGNFDGLVESLGASRRLASRAGALARKGLLLSEAVVEFAASPDGGPLSKLLLSKPLLAGADSLDEPALAALCEGEDFFSENPLTLVPHGQGRVLCLLEEADDGQAQPRQAASAESPAGENPLAMQGRPGALIAPEEARKLLAPEEISRLKMELVTSSDAGRRLESVRKLWFSELSRDEKLKLFLTGLRDRDAEVRAEAARALGGLGLDGSLAETLAKASRGATPERVVAISNLTPLLPRLDEAQRRLALSVLVELAEPSEDTDVVNAALGAATVIVPDSGVGGELTAALHKKLVELLEVHGARYRQVAGKVYGALYGLRREEVSAMLAQAVEESSQEDVRLFALGLICRHDLEAAAQPAVVVRLVEGLAKGSELDQSYQACISALSDLGERAIDPMLEAMANRDDITARRVIDLIGVMLRENTLSDEAAARACAACLELYPTRGGEVRVALLETRFAEHRAVSDEQREEAARAFIDGMHEFRFERQQEMLANALRRCGPAALQPLRSAMLESAHDVTRLWAARLLPDVVEGDESVGPAPLLGLLDEVRAQIEDEEGEFPDSRPLYVALGRLGAHSNIEAATATGLAEYLTDRLGHSSSAYDVLEALGYLASGENLDAPLRVEIGHLLLSVINRGLPGISGRMARNEEGEQVLHFGRETTAYTDMIPRVLEGVGRLIEAPGTPDALYQRLTSDLLRIWREVSEYRRIWAPAATLKLATLLGRIALGEARDKEIADEIAELLSSRLYLLPVLQVIAELMTVRPESERMDAVAARVFADLAKRLNAEPEPDMVERRQILETMTAIIKRKRMGETEREIAQARRVVVEALFDALRDKIFQARGMLESLTEHNEVSETIRSDIARRLKSARKQA